SWPFSRPEGRATDSPRSAGSTLGPTLVCADGQAAGLPAVRRRLGRAWADGMAAVPRAPDLESAAPTVLPDGLTPVKSAARPDRRNCHLSRLILFSLLSLLWRLSVFVPTVGQRFRSAGKHEKLRQARSCGADPGVAKVVL